MKIKALQTIQEVAWGAGSLIEVGKDCLEITDNYGEHVSDGSIPGTKSWPRMPLFDKPCFHVKRAGGVTIIIPQHNVAAVFVDKD